MAKINTGTITAGTNGSWSSDAISFANGAQRVYMRVNGTQVLYRDFTVGTAEAAIEAGFPKYTAQVRSSTNTISSGSFSTGGASMMVLVLSGNNDAGTAIWNVSITGAAGLTWTRIQDQQAGTAFGGAIWYAWSTGALSNQTVTVTYANTVSAQNCLLSLYSVTGASSTIGVSAGSRKTDTPPAQDYAIDVTGCTTGSIIIGAGIYSAGTLPTAVTDTTTDNSSADGGAPNVTGHFHHHVAASGTRNVGYTGSNYWTIIMAVEVLKA